MTKQKEQQTGNFITVKEGTNIYHHHLITADFLEFNFEDFKKCNKDKTYGGVFWYNNSNHKFYPNDTVYIYYFNLPDGISRILVKCKVVKEDVDSAQNKGVILKFESGLYTPEIDKMRFKRNELLDKYGINVLRGKKYLKEDLRQFHKETEKEDYYQKNLLNDLEEAFEDESQRYRLTGLEENLKAITECSLKKLTTLKSTKDTRFTHDTFFRENNTQYIEGHHLIEQYHSRKEGDLKIDYDILNNPYNIIPLCPNCHRRIHHGKKEDRIKMVTYLYCSRKSNLDELLNQIPEVKNNYQKKELIWLLKQYDVNINEIEMQKAIKECQTVEE